jgi:hypothetical protein
MLNDYVRKIGSGHPIKVHYPGDNNKWQPIYDQLDKMPVVKSPRENLNDGWMSFGIVDKKLAAGAASSVSSYCDRVLKCKEAKWRIQTTIETTPDGTVLWLRKIQIK